MGEERQRYTQSDDDICCLVDAAFGTVEKPEHFTNFTHCDECAEHDATMRAHDRSTLTVDDVNHPGWDPLCFTSPRGKAYYMPALIRFALERSGGRSQPYWGQLLVHLEGDGPNNELIRYCDLAQRRAIAAYLEHLVETRTVEVEQSGSFEELLKVHGYWSNTAPSLAGET
jgi:hypothetical protein